MHMVQRPYLNNFVARPKGDSNRLSVLRNQGVETCYLHPIRNSVGKYLPKSILECMLVLSTKYKPVTHLFILVPENQVS
jgi:hypothetical protein